jgi:hypothetical protein
VEKKSHYLIADILNQKLPLPNLREKKNFDLEKDADYCTLSFEYENNYSEMENLPSGEIIAKELAYEYLLIVVRSLIGSLKNFECHQEDYLEGLTE